MPPLVVAGVMVATMAAGTALSAISASRQGSVSGDTAILNSRLQARELAARARQADQQAGLIEREAQSADYAAEEARQATAFEVGRQQTQARAFQAQQRAEVAGSGLEATGSPLLVMAETAKQLELDRLALQHGGEVKAREAEDQARLSRYQAGLVREQAGELRKGVPLTLDIGRYQARAARQAGDIGVARSILGGGAAGLNTFYRMYG